GPAGRKSDLPPRPVRPRLQRGGGRRVPRPHRRDAAPYHRRAAHRGRRARGEVLHRAVPPGVRDRRGGRVPRRDGRGDRQTLTPGGVAGRPARAVRRGGAMSRYVDLSVPIATGIPVYPGAPQVELSPTATVATHGCNVLGLRLGSHTGTHVDAPYHVGDDLPKLDELPFDRFVGPAVVV